ncbi:MAG: hypothetical protein VW397_05080 [Candidatus Margulisiibacteriota bacterium]
MNRFSEFLKDHWLGLIPVILLAFISLRQIYLYNVDNLSRWKGGGFGMFSTIDRRYFHIHLIYKEAIECAEPHIEFDRQFEKIKSYPNYLDLERLTKKLSKKIWIYNFGTKTKQKPTSVKMIGKNQSLRAEDRISNFNAIEIQVFTVKFNKANFTMEPKLIRKMKFLK